MAGPRGPRKKKAAPSAADDPRRADREHAEDAPRQSEERLRRLFETMAEGVVLIAADGRIVSANTAVESMLGISRSEIEGRAYDSLRWEMLRPDRTPMPWEETAASRAMKEKRAVRDVVMGAVRPDGAVSWINVNAAPFLDAAGEPEGAVGTFTDITERKQAEDTLRRQKRELSTLVENAPDMIVRFDTDLRHVYCNAAVERQLGVPVRMFLGKTPLETGAPREQAEFGYQALRQALETGEEQAVEQSYPLPSGQKHFSTRVVPERDEQGSIESLLAITSDVTERKQAEQALREINDELVSEAAALAEANATITLIAATDDLTGLANRRCFYESLEKAVSLARRHGSPLAVVSLDLDGLKRVNDSAGHAAGDEALTSFAGLVIALCRAEDLPGRLGGDEFSLLLPGVDLSGARGLAERVLAAVRSSPVLAQRGVTVSGGFAQWAPGELSDDLLRRADEALYAAKRGGGDAVAGDA